MTTELSDTDKAIIELLPSLTDNNRRLLLGVARAMVDAHQARKIHLSPKYEPEEMLMATISKIHARGDIATLRAIRRHLGWERNKIESMMADFQQKGIVICKKSLSGRTAHYSIVE